MLQQQTCTLKKQTTLQTVAYLGFPGDQSRRHGKVLVGLSPQTKLQAPPNWNVKHYK